MIRGLPERQCAYRAGYRCHRRYYKESAEAKVKKRKAKREKERGIRRTEEEQ